MINKSLLIILILSFSLLASDAQEIFRSEKYGFNIAIPKGWHIINNQKLDYNLKEQHGQHVISFSKYDVTNHVGLNPIISIHTGSNYMSFKKWTKVFLKEKNWRNKNYKNFSAIEKAQVVNIDNKNAIYSFENYTQTHYALRRKSYLVPHKDYMFYIDFIDGQQSEDEQKLFNELVKSIKFDN